MNDKIEKWRVEARKARQEAEMYFSGHNDLNGQESQARARAIEQMLTDLALEFEVVKTALKSKECHTAFMVFQEPYREKMVEPQGGDADKFWEFCNAWGDSIKAFNAAVDRLAESRHERVLEIELEKRGVIARPKGFPSTEPRVAIEVKGEPVSETIIRDRR